MFFVFIGLVHSSYIALDVVQTIRILPRNRDHKYAYFCGKY